MAEVQLSQTKSSVGAQGVMTNSSGPELAMARSIVDLAQQRARASLSSVTLAAIPTFWNKNLVWKAEKGNDSFDIETDYLFIKMLNTVSTSSIEP